jgi:hypothetical protein
MLALIGFFVLGAMFLARVPDRPLSSNITHSGQETA